MNFRKAWKKLDKTSLLLVALIFITLAATFRKGRLELTLLGFKQASQLIQQVWLRILLGFILGGLIKVLVPNSLIAEWLGPASGLKGILIGSYVGIIMPGSPYVFLPVIASIYTAGAGVGPVISFLVSSGLISLQMLFVWQIPLLGFKIALTRYIVTFFFPPLVGLAGGAIYQILSAV